MWIPLGIPVPSPMSMEIEDKSRPSVLLVDDVAQLRDSLSQMLASEFDVTCVTSAAHALEILRGTQRFSVVISDYDMPDTSSVDLMRVLEEERPELALIMLTGAPELDLTNDISSHRFLVKPCGVRDLVDAVRSGVEYSHAYVDEELELGELEFGFGAMTELNHSLELRVREQGESIASFRRMTAGLNEADDLDEIAWVTATAAYEVLGGRGIFVQIMDRGGVRAEQSLGPEMSQRMIAEPMMTKDGAIGEIVIDVLGPDGRRASRADQHLLAAIASTAAVAAHSEFSKRERDDSQYATVVALARLSEQRDQETGQHLDRVSAYCRLIAETMRERGLYPELLTNGYIRDLERSAPLHDIGKVGIPDSILLKKGKLTASEWEVMKTHAEIGADTLRSVTTGRHAPGYLLMGLEVALGHHERWDGSGYPAGIEGLDIPLCARIVALADVYDALTNHRPYKVAWAHTDAMALIEESSGSHFDPEVVESFLSVEAVADEIHRRLADEDVDALRGMRRVG